VDLKWLQWGSHLAPPRLLPKMSLGNNFGIRE